MHAHDGTAYIHCTAGLGRAPAVALAYMWWMEDFTLEEAYSTLFAVRPCHPQLKSVRAAACDILDGGMQEQVSERVDAVNARSRSYGCPLAKKQFVRTHQETVCLHAKWFNNDVYIPLPQSAISRTVGIADDRSVRAQPCTACTHNTSRQRSVLSDSTTPLSYMAENCLDTILIPFTSIQSGV